MMIAPAGNRGELRAILTEQFFLDVAAGYAQTTRDHYVRSLNDFERFLCRPAQLDDLCPGKVLPWLAWLPLKPLAPETVKKERACIVCFWDWCARKRLAEEFPVLPRFVAPAPQVTALTVEQVAAFLKACETVQGTIEGMPARYYWTALGRFCLDHGERTSALLALQWQWLDLDRGYLFAHGSIRKGKKSMAYPLRPWVVESLRRIATPERELVFPWSLDRASFYNHFRRIWDSAGLPPTKRIGPQRLRVTHATHLKRNGGNPTESLAHSSPAVTERYYLDYSQLQPKRHADALEWGRS